MDGPRQRIREARRGEPVTAARQSLVEQGLNRVTRGAAPPQARRGQGLPPALVRQFRISSVDGDYLVCRFFDGLVDGPVTVNVAKPYLLRRTPFDGSSRNGVTYTYTSPTARNADNGSEDEDQVVVPAYVAGDVIYAMNFVDDDTGVLADAIAPEWIDLNLDARAWALVTE